MANKIDSNVVGLSFAEEASIGTLTAYTPAVAATGLLTFDDNPTDGDLVVVGAKSYRFKDTMAQANDIQIGINAWNSRDNLVAAINDIAGETFVYYVGTTVNLSVSATADDSDMIVTALTAGAAGNSIVSTTTGSDLSWEDTTLNDGADTVGIPTIWRQLDPNSFSDFGAKYATKARNTINKSRSRKKSSIVGLDVTAGYNADLTQNSLTRLIQSFFFAAAREQVSTDPLNGTNIPLTSVSGTQYVAASGLGTFIVNSLVKASGFTTTGNNGLKLVTAVSGTTVTAAGLTIEASPPATAKLDRVGYRFPSADVAMSVSPAGMARMTSSAITMTTLNLVVGQWVFLGGDSTNTYWTTNIGFARVSAVAAAYIDFDKTDWTPAIEAGTGKTIQMFWGTVIKNEDDSTLITKRTLQLERQMGEDDDGIQSEYIIGAVANTLGLSMPQEDLIACDLSFVGIGHERRDGDTGIKAGTRIDLIEEDAFNTSSDFARIKLGIVDTTTSNGSSLFGYVTDLNININNSVVANKALGTLGAFDTSAGNFEVDGKITAYFTEFLAVQAIEANADVTLDLVMVRDNAGLLIDIPLMTLGGGLLTVEKDKPVMIPVDGMACQSDMGHTLLYQHFAYLPDAASA